MEKEDILNFIEYKSIEANENWYFHATSYNTESIKRILNEGIKSPYLRNEKRNNFNGKYYVSLYKNNDDATEIKKWLINYPKFIIEKITPLSADRKKYKFRRIFINTRIPLRTSDWEGEFQQYLKVDSKNIIALEYSLYEMSNNSDNQTLLKELTFLKELILVLNELNKPLPIYDLSSNREINKQKVLSLDL